jgi:hypothetical protein
MKLYLSSITRRLYYGTSQPSSFSTLLSYCKPEYQDSMDVLCPWWEVTTTFHNDLLKLSSSLHPFAARKKANTVEPLLSRLRLTMPFTGTQFLSTFSARAELWVDSHSYIYTRKENGKWASEKIRACGSKQRFLTEFFKKDSWETYRWQKVKTVTYIPF